MSSEKPVEEHLQRTDRSKVVRQGGLAEGRPLQARTSGDTTGVSGGQDGGQRATRHATQTEQRSHESGRVSVSGGTPLKARGQGAVVPNGALQAGSAGVWGRLGEGRVWGGTAAAGLSGCAGR